MNSLSERIVSCAIEVHRHLGPGLLGRLHERALLHELETAGLRTEQQVPVVIDYKGIPLSGQRLDLVVNSSIVLELKALERIADVLLAQLVGCLRAGRYPLGLLINFNVPLLKNRVYRRANSAALRSQDESPQSSSAPSASPPRPPRSPHEPC